MREEIRRLGNAGRLSGIVTLPPDHAAHTAKGPLVIFITAGLVHKPGPHRLYVQLARTLAASGFTCLRFDLSGIGESAFGHDRGDAERAAVDDVREVMDELASEYDATTFVLAGLCSGAEVAHRTAVADARVRGMVALDGYILRNVRYYVHHYLPRVFSLRKWLDFARSRLHGGASGLPHDAEQEALEFWAGPPPSRAALENDFRALVSRDVRQLQVFSGGSGDCSYENQFRDVFSNVDFRNTLTLRYNRAADHMYILSSDRRNLIRTITRWMHRNFPRELGKPVIDSQHGNLLQPDLRQGRLAARLAPGWKPEQPARLAGRRHLE